MTILGIVCDKCGRPPEPPTFNTPLFGAIAEMLFNKNDAPMAAYAYTELNTERCPECGRSFTKEEGERKSRSDGLARIAGNIGWCGCVRCRLSVPVQHLDAHTASRFCTPDQQKGLG